MDFTLPASLTNKLSAYDPSKPKVRSNNPSARPASIAPCDDLIPFEIVSQADQAAAVAHVRSQVAATRYYVFTGLLGEFRAALYYANSTWVALWFAPDCLYGFSYATKDSSSFRKDSRSAELDWTEKKYGRFKVSVCTHTIRTEDVKTEKKWGRKYWCLFDELKSYGRHRMIYDRSVQPFMKKLKGVVPTWTDKNWGEVFERLGPDNRIGRQMMSSVYCDSSGNLTFESLVEGSKKNTSIPTYDQHVCTKVFNRPSIRRLIIARIDDINSKFYDPEYTEYYELRKLTERLTNYIKWVSLTVRIWPEVQLDHLANYADALHFCEAPYYVASNAEVWLRSNMKPDTLFNLLERANSSGQPYEVRDSIRMIDACAPDLSVPERWRDLHDHVQKESWKRSNELQKLPQDLFSEPVKFEDWTFFQPSDTHQLADWGRHVRNCVGNSGYAEGVRKKKHFIVLCMRSKKPTFTVQLKLESDRLHVTQIVGLSNSLLTAHESAEYSQAFAKALSMVS